MHHSSHGLRIALPAGASVVALVAATPSAGAADLSKPPSPRRNHLRRPPERGGPGGSRAERLTHLAMLSVWALGSATSGRSGAGKPRQASIGCRAGGSGISAANSATVQRKKLRHSKLGSGRHRRLLLLPPEAQHLLWLKATTRKYVTRAPHLANNISDPNRRRCFCTVHKRGSHWKHDRDLQRGRPSRILVQSQYEDHRELSCRRLFQCVENTKPGTSSIFKDVDQIYNGPMLRLTSTW